MAIYELDGIGPDLPADGDYWVAPNAAVIGNVRLEAGASVWWSSVLRGDNERILVGAGSNIQDNCTLHTDPGYALTVGPGVIVGHHVMLHGCTIGEGALIGIGSTVLNGARIGAGAIVGAHSLVPEGKEIPAGTLALGAPARVVRELSEHERGALMLQAAAYVANWRRYRAGLREIGGT